MAGTVSLVRRAGKVNGAKYNQILEENQLLSARNLSMGRRFTFQHHNDPKHTTKLTALWLKGKCPVA